MRILGDWYIGIYTRGPAGWLGFSYPNTASFDGVNNMWSFFIRKRIHIKVTLNVVLLVYDG